MEGRPIEFLKGIAAVILAWWAGLDPTWRVLLAFQVLDVITGVLVAGQKGEISSDRSYAGMKRKALVWILIAAAGLLASVTKLMGLPYDVPGQAIVAVFYCLTEFISITENIGRAGVPLPPYVSGLLEKLRSTQPQPKN